MSITLTIADKVRVPVAGTFTDEAGKAQPFNFTLTCRRLGAQALRDLFDKPETKIKDLLSDVTLGWDGVTYGDTSSPVPFTREAFEQLLDLPGLATLVLNAYTTEQSAKAKN